MAEKIGERFQRETQYDRRRMPSGQIDLDKKPEMYKEYPQAKTIELIKPEKCGDMSLYEAILRRQSLRRFLDVPVSLDAISCILWASSGFEFRTSPSAGGLYPIETYLVANVVEDLNQGVYHYNVKHNYLEELKLGDFRETTAQAALGQVMCAKAAAVVVWTAIFERSIWKYKQRAYRYIYLEAGHMAQNLALTTTSLGLGCCHVAALFDNEVNEILGISGTGEGVLYMSVIGQTGMFV